MEADVYTFGPFRLDADDRRLTRDGEPVEVSPRYFDALRLLAAEQGRLVTKDRFLAEVWRGVPVTDEALTQCIRALRKALGDDVAAPRYIETVPRHGYRFVAPVSAAGPAPTTIESPRESLAPLARDIVAAALGGGIAGIVGAMAYVMGGLIAPGIGAASTLLVLVSVNLLLGLAGGAAVGAGFALAQRVVGPSLWAAALGGAAGGALVGAVARMVGTDLLTLFFGQAPATMTGAAEALVLGGATGAALWGALQLRSRARGIGTAVLLGTLAGSVIALSGGRLMIGSLAALAERFAQSQLRFNGLTPAALGAATAAECALFAGCVAAAVMFARRLARA
jgi:DNA-binding winged helix-turn-helix (wHTH) protein